MTETTSVEAAGRQGFLKALREQRWDDHRYYHQHRINQSLHLFSALSFLTAYALIASNPMAAAMLGWFVAMCSRQLGHFFFEPKGYDEVNAVTHAHKERIKIGYNLKRKIVLLSIWALIPVALWFDRSFFGLVEAHTSWGSYLHNLGVLWLFLAPVAIVFRTAQLFFVRDVQTGLVWATKILTDPFHDVLLYHRAPLLVLRGQMLDPMEGVARD